MIQCQDEKDEGAECVTCLNRRRDRQDLMFWRITSTCPDRRTVVVFCDECMGKLQVKNWG